MIVVIGRFLRRFIIQRFKASLYLARRRCDCSHHLGIEKISIRDTVFLYHTTFKGFFANIIQNFRHRPLRLSCVLFEVGIIGFAKVRYP